MANDHLSHPVPPGSSDLGSSDSGSSTTALGSSDSTASLENSPCNTVGTKNTSKASGGSLRILIIRPSALGDVCRTVPALATLQKALPHARIDWLVQKTFAPAIAAHPAVHQTLAFDRKRYRKLLLRPSQWASFGNWLKQLKHNNYDMVFDLQGLARSGFFTKVTGAKTRVGYANAREGGHLGYNHRYQIDPNLHAVDRMLALLQAHGFKPQTDMRLFTPAEDQTWADDYLKQVDINTQPFVILAPTAQWLCKCWPIDRFISLAKRLRDEKK
ncbi:MAG: glycosyltransferase family 9 protein [Phycisphaeraceae bacterium]|nr:glycosyltransferase family 9 protein [Phycisphaeraceae bacterium]